MKPIRLSFVVSTFNRPRQLQLALLSLTLQIETDIEILVADNSTDAFFLARNKEICAFDSRIRHSHIALADCYSSSQQLAIEAVGDFLCFPSDDSYYVPGFATFMLKAATENNWDLVYCNRGDDPRHCGGNYAVVVQYPQLGYIDKTGFIIRRTWFTGFPGICPGWCSADWLLIEDVIKRGISHGHIDQLLLFHN